MDFLEVYALGLQPRIYKASAALADVYEQGGGFGTSIDVGSAATLPATAWQVVITSNMKQYRMIQDMCL